MGVYSHYALIAVLVFVFASPIYADTSWSAPGEADATCVWTDFSHPTPLSDELSYPDIYDSADLPRDPDWGADCGDSCRSECFAGCASCRCDDCRLWSVDAGAVILHRASPHSLVLLRDDTTGEPIANANRFKFPWRGGAEISIARRLAHGELEVRYFGVEDWLARRAIDVSENVDSGGNLVTVNSAAANYTSELHSAEINWRRPLTPAVDWLIGFRWIELHENLAISADVVDEAFPEPVVVSLPFDTLNQLYGGQIGADVKLWDAGGPFQVDTAIKAGLYGNSADTEFAIQIADFTLGSLHSAGSHPAFLGEIELCATYQWTQRVALRGGYQLIWISGAALPPEQLANFLANHTGIDISGTVFYQGATVGAELNW